MAPAASPRGITVLISADRHRFPYNDGPAAVTLDRRGQHIAFLSVDAHWVQDGARRCVARGRITKTIMSMAQRKRPRRPPSG